VIGRLLLLFLCVGLLGCGESSTKITAHDAGLQRAVEAKIRQTINFKALGAGASVRSLLVQCVPEDDVHLSCIVSGSVDGAPATTVWKGVVDQDTGKFNVYSTTP
jgi:hypothetical protein